MWPKLFKSQSIRKFSYHPLYTREEEEPAEEEGTIRRHRVKIPRYHQPRSIYWGRSLVRLLLLLGAVFYCIYLMQAW